MQIDAEWVVLGTVGTPSRVQGNDFIAENIIAWCNAAGYGDCPAVVGCYKLVCGPCAGNRAIVYQASGVELVKLQSSLVDGGAITVAVC